jgi:hypothetical protein
MENQVIEVLLAVLLSMGIVVVGTCYWSIFKWVLLVLATVIVWLGVAVLLLGWFVSSEPNANEWMLSLAAISWPVLAWVIWSEITKPRKPKTLA